MLLSSGSVARCAPLLMLATLASPATGLASPQVTPASVTSAGAAADRPARSLTYVLSNLAPVFTEGSLGQVERNQSVGGLGPG
ncbi:MAG: hypothetical protein AAGG01_11115, partial [Planctomycetota bacterium]